MSSSIATLGTEMKLAAQIPVPMIGCTGVSSVTIKHTGARSALSIDGQPGCPPVRSGARRAGCAGWHNRVGGQLTARGGGTGVAGRRGMSGAAAAWQLERRCKSSRCSKVASGMGEMLGIVEVLFLWLQWAGGEILWCGQTWSPTQQSPRQLRHHASRRSQSENGVPKRTWYALVECVHHGGLSGGCLSRLRQGQQ